LKEGKSYFVLEGNLNVPKIKLKKKEGFENEEDLVKHGKRK